MVVSVIYIQVMWPILVLRIHGREKIELFSILTYIICPWGKKSYRMVQVLD